MEHFQNGQDGGQATALKEMPSFIKPAPASSASTGTSSGQQMKKKLKTLDQLEPVIVSGVSSISGSGNSSAQTQLGPNQNNPSPQNYTSSQKGLDLLTGGDIVTPRGDPQLVGLTKLTYEAGGIQLAQASTVDTCSAEDFQDCFIERTLHNYYKNTSSGEKSHVPAAPGSLIKGNTLDSGDESPERTGTSKQRARDTSGGSRRGGAGALNRSLNGKNTKGDNKRAANLLLQQAKRAPYDYCKVGFLIKLPYEMQIEQIQFLLPQPGSDETSQSSHPVAPDATQQVNQSSQTKQRSAGNNMLIVSKNPSSHITSMESQQQVNQHANDSSFSANFKILNISTLKSPDQSLGLGAQQSTESRHKTSLYGKGNMNRQMREHRHIAIKSAFSEDVTGKNMIEVNSCAVTKQIHVTLLCLRQDVAQVVRDWKQQPSFCSSRKSKTSVLDATLKTNAGAQQGPPPKKEVKVTGAKRLIAEIEDFDMLDEHDQEVAFISNHHYQDPNENQDGGIIDHEQIALHLRGDEDDFDRDSYDDDLANFKVGSIIQNDEDDLRILDSLPITVKPKNLRNSFNSRKNNSIKLQKSAKADTEIQQAVQLQGPLGRYLDKIVIYGFNVNSIPAITNLTYFMNQAFFLRKQKKYYQAEEVDCMIGTLMITTKRATQAGEFFRRMENQIVKKINRNLSKLEKQNSDISSNNATFQAENELKTETQNLLLQCAVYELLVADGLSFETQLNEKIQALSRVVAFTEGQIPQQMKFAPQVLITDDSFSALLRILPQLLRFCILALTHRKEIVRISALKILKFVLETQGCSLDASMIYILKGMFLTYPRTHTQNSQQNQAEKDAAEKLKKQPSMDDSPSPQSRSSQKVPDESDSATKKKLNQSAQKIYIMQNDFDLTLLVGESEAATMTVSDYIFSGQFRNGLLSNSTNNIGESHLHAVEPEANLYATKYQEMKEPASGFSTALQNVYSHVLETFISVLSSISSHILHRIFYDVIEDALCATPADQAQAEIINAKNVHVNQSASFKGHSISGVQSAMRMQARALMGQSSQIKVYACKIAEKIITICQGDLNMSPNLLSALVDSFSSNKPLLPADNSSNQAHAAMKNLWTSIKQKVFPNYSTKGYRKLIEWINGKMRHLILSSKTHPQDLLATKPESQRKDAFPHELSDEENIILLQLCEVVNIVTFNRLKQEEEANQLIKLPTAESFGNGASSEMYLLVPQLIFFLEYSIDREDRLQLFQQLYQTVKDVLESVPTNGRSRENQLSVVQIMMPTLRRTCEFLQSNSPSLPMLKFMDIVLSDIQLTAHDRKSKQQQNLSLSPQQMQNNSRQQAGYIDNSVADPLKLQGFFLELLENFVTSLSYSLYEEAFSVFDKLLYLTGDAINEHSIKKCIVALVDKYTLKSKSHKASTTTFMKSLMDVKVKRMNQSPNVSRVQNTTGHQTQNNRNLSSPGSPEFEDMGLVMNENDLSSNNPQQGNYFEVMAEFCFFENVDSNYKQLVKEGVIRAIDDKNEHNMHGLPQLDLRGPIDMHELFIDKLQFFIDSLALMTETHIGMFTYLITNNSFKTILLQLLEHGETHVRMKAHEILEALTSYYVQCCPSKTVYEFPAGSTQGRDGNLLPEGTKKMEAEFIAHERLFISQIVIQVAKRSLQQTSDCYLQFNALILLDFLFQNLLPVPTFQNEQVKARKMNRRQTPTAQEPQEVELTMDIEVLSISDMTPELDVMDPAYLRMRMKLVLSLWPHIQSALASPWSNIRSICYGLICSMLKINVADYPLVPDQQALSREIGNQAREGQQLSPTNNLSEIIGDQAALSEDRNKDQLILSDILSINVATQARLKDIVLPMLYSLLSSKESESKAGGLNILGSFCGLSYDFSQVKINQNLMFLQRNSQFISLPIWRLVYQLQDDWDITIKEASVVLVQLCAPRNAITYFQSLKEKRQQKKLTYMMNQMSNVQSIYVRRGFIEAEDEEEKNLIRAIRPESRLNIQNFLVRRNEFAARAYLRFPTDNDIEVILGKPKNAGKSLKSPSEEMKDGHSFSWMQESTLINEALNDQHGNFSEFLAGKVPLQPGRGAFNHAFELQAVSCQMIEQENLVLSEKVHAFNPDYEDTRFIRNLSRKRQLEIELDMPPRRGRGNDKTNLNFFVDTYSDEQIQEIISIFRNDFKPPKNLWIEKQPSPQSLVSGGMSNAAIMAQAQQQNMRSQSPDYYQDIYAEAIEQFNQQQQQMQQQQQAQLQQQVQSGSSSGGSSRESSPLSHTSSSPPPNSSSPVPNLSGTATTPVIGQPTALTLPIQQEPVVAARLSPQPAGRMLDPLEDDQLRKYAEEHHQKQLSASQGSGSAKSHKSSQHTQSHHSSQDEKLSAHQTSIGVQPFGEAEELEVDSRKASTTSKDKSQGVVWAQDGLHPGVIGEESAQQAQQPYKSESMGLLDAEGYKFLEASDSNSDGGGIVVDHIADNLNESHEPTGELIYEIRPAPQPQPSQKRKQHKRQFSNTQYKIESLNFEAIQICSVPSQPKQQPLQQTKRHKQQQQHHHQLNIEQQPQQNRIEFYQEPGQVAHQESDYAPQQQNSSRLGQRSSRLHAAQQAQIHESGGLSKQRNSLGDGYAQMDSIQRQMEADEEARYIKTQKLFKKLKSPTEKLIGAKHNNFTSFGGSGGHWEQQHEAAGPTRNKSNESRKRKKSLSGNQVGGNLQKPSKSFTKGGKPPQLKLMENDYFSAEDKHINHLKNLTQKVVSHQLQGGSLTNQLNSWANNGTAGKASRGNSGQQPGTTRTRTKSIGNVNSISTPDFNALANKLSQKLQPQQQQVNIINGKPSQEVLEATSSQDIPYLEMLDNKISRKMAQTYLSGLSKGFIANMDNLKLINTCLHKQDQQSTTAGSNQNSTILKLNKSLGSAPGSQAKPQHQQLKVINKSFEKLGAHAKLKQSNNNGSLLVDLQLMNPKSTVSYQTQRSRGGKNSTLSTSPKRKDGSQTTRMGSSANYQRKQKSLEKGMGKKNKQVQQRASSDSKGGINVSGTGSGHKKAGSGGISDLHLFIKTIEKDLTEKFKSMQDIGVKGPATPNQILRKVEDQMRAFGLDPKSGSNQATAQALALKFAHSEQAQHNSAGNQLSLEKKRKKSLPPKLKLLGLNQVFASGNTSGSGHDPNSAALYQTQNQNITPSNLSSNGSGNAFMAKSHLNIHGPGGGSSKKHNEIDHYQRSSGSRRRKRSGGPRDRSNESRTSRQRTKSGRLSTGRGASSGSGGRTAGGGISHQIPYPPMVMTERCSTRPNRQGGKSSQERPKAYKSSTKGGGSALSRPSKKPKLAKQQTASPDANHHQVPQSQLQNQQAKALKVAKLNKNKDSKGTSMSAMNQIATGFTTDPQLLQQILKGTGGSISVRNSDYNHQLKIPGQKGSSNHQQMNNPFLLGKPKNVQQKMTPASTKGSQTNRLQGNNTNNNILYELIQSQEQQPHHQQRQPKKANKELLSQTQQLSLSGSQSSRTPHTTSGQPIKMIKNKKLSQQQQPQSQIQANFL